MSFLELSGLSKAFVDDEPVVSDVSLAVERGEIVALLGPSGSGKTTLLRLLAGFVDPDAGSVSLDGSAIGHLPPARRGIGMVFQHYALFPHLDVGGNVAFGLRSKGLEREAARRRVAEVLELVDLAGFEGRPVAELSGGQQQRVAVARALAPEPAVLLLDEPLSNLDPTLRERTRRALKALVRRVGITTVLVTHEQQEAFDLGDRIAVLWRGRLQQVGTPEALHERPINRFVATFVGRANLLAGTLTEVADGKGLVRIAGVDGGLQWPGEMADGLEVGADIELMLRPEALRIVPDTDGDGAPGVVPGTVLERLYGGGVSHFRIRLGDADEAPEVEVLARSAMAAQGDRVLVAPQPAGPAGRIWKGHVAPARGGRTPDD